VPSRSLRLLALCFTASLAVAACSGGGDDDSASPTSAGSATTVTVLNASGEAVDAATLNSTAGNNASLIPNDPAVDPTASTVASNAGGDQLGERTHEVVSDKQVELGVTKTKAILQEVAKSLQSGGTVDFEVTALLNTWYSYEGTIEKKDPTAYETMDAALSAVSDAAKAADQGKVTAASDAFVKAADAYLAG
jgi:hypothetical protein